MVKYVLRIFCLVLTLVILVTIWQNHKTENLKFQYDEVNYSKPRNYSTRLLNLNSFEYIVRAQCCDPLTKCETVEYLWIITSFAGDVKKRSLLRQAYSSEQLLSLSVRRVFLLGMLHKDNAEKYKISQAAIENEAQRFQDIVQGNFIEAYKNLTYKHIMGLMWSVNDCGNRNLHIIKMDDDIVINLFEILNLIRESPHNTDNFLMGYVMDKMIPKRNRANKWFVGFDEFPRQKYPPFLSGWLYVIDVATAQKLLLQSYQEDRYFWVDDVFVTGILRENAGIGGFININPYFTTDYRFLYCCLNDEDLKYKCDFLVGPDGDDPNVLLKFQKHSEYCFTTNKCLVRPVDKLLKDKCILKEFDNTQLREGEAKIEKLI